MSVQCFDELAFFLNLFPFAADSRSPSAQAYISLLKKHFSPVENLVAIFPTVAVCGSVFLLQDDPDGYYTMFDVMAFYSDFYDTVHLPREIELNAHREVLLIIFLLSN